MKISIIVMIFLMLLTGINTATGEDIIKIPLELGSFTVPDSPGFEVLGTSPSSVSRPGSVRELAISLFSSSIESSSSFPKNLALDFSPYWWTYHPNLAWEDLYPKNEVLGNNLIQTFTVSFATSNTKLTIDEKEVEGTGVGLGFRANLLKGHPSKKGFEAFKNVQRIFSDNVDAIIPDDPTNLETDDEGNRIINLDNISDPAVLKKIQKVLEGFRMANLNRVGLRLEFAGAASFNFPDDKADDEELRNLGFWMTSAYRTDENSFLDSIDFLGVFRYLWNDLNSESFSSYDVGARIVWISQKDDFPLSLSGEYVYRFVSDNDKKDTKKQSFIVEYRANETWSLFVSLGRSFDPNFEGNEDFVTLMGVDFGFGKGPIVATTVK